MKPTLLVLALILTAGIAVWYGRSGTGPGPGPIAPAPSVQPSGAAGETARLESEAAARKPVPDPVAQPAAGETGAAATPAAPPLIDLVASAGGQDGGIASDASSTTDASPFEAKYAGASKDDLKANYEALRLLFDEHAQGRVEDKERQLSPEALAELEKEVAWLKEKAFGGG